MEVIAFACPVSVLADIAVRRFEELADPRLARAVATGDSRMREAEVTLVVVLGARGPRAFDGVAREHWLMLEPSRVLPGYETGHITKLHRHVERMIAERGWGRARHDDAARSSPLPSV